MAVRRKKEAAENGSGKEGGRGKKEQESSSSERTESVSDHHTQTGQTSIALSSFEASDCKSKSIIEFESKKEGKKNSTTKEKLKRDRKVNPLPSPTVVFRFCIIYY